MIAVLKLENLTRGDLIQFSFPLEISRFQEELFYIQNITSPSDSCKKPPTSVGIFWAITRNGNKSFIQFFLVSENRFRTYLILQPTFGTVENPTGDCLICTARGWAKIKDTFRVISHAKQPLL